MIYRRAVLKKDKSFIGSAQIFVRTYDMDHKKSQIEAKQSKWKKQEDTLADLDETIGQSGRLFLRNLSYSVVEDDLDALFKPFGPLAELHLPIDRVTKQVKGFAFVTFVIPENAVQAFTKLDGTTFQGMYYVYRFLGYQALAAPSQICKFCFVLFGNSFRERPL